MSVDAGPEARGGASFQRENLSDLDDVSTTGAPGLSRLVFGPTVAKWTYGGNIGGANPPVAAAGANAGTSPPVPVVVTGSTDARGSITFGSGSGSPAAGAQVTVTFHVALAAGVVPFVHIQETNSATKTVNAYPSSISNTGFTISTVSALGTSQANTVYAVEYSVEA